MKVKGRRIDHYYPISAECVSKEALDKLDWLREFHKDWIINLRLPLE